jgi:hypothetical protein
VSYKIGFDGVVTAELEKLLQSVEKQVNGFGIHAQASDLGASTVASGSAPSPCSNGHPCPDSPKGGHYIVVALIAVVVGAAAGYMAGKKAAQRVLESAKGGHV